MSVQRERVAKAMLRDAVLRWDGTDKDVETAWGDSVTQQEYLLQADAAMAAMQAEPTEAEIDAAQRVYWETLQSTQDDDTTDLDKSRYAMRIALYAARTAGQP